MDEEKNLSALTVNQILEEARQRGYKIYTVDTTDARTFGQFRIRGSRVTNGPDLWMNASNVALWEKQSA